LPLIPLRLPQPPTQSVLGILLSLQKYRWVLPLCNLMVLEYTLHRCPLEFYTPMGLMCQAIAPTQSSNPAVPFSAWLKAGPLYSWLESSLLDFYNCKTEVPSSGSKVLLLCPADTGSVIFLDGCFLAVVFPCSSCTQVSSLQIGSPSCFSCPPPGHTERTTGLHMVCATGTLSLEPKKADS